MKTEVELHHKLAEIQTQLNAPKNQHNKFGNYKYRSAEDILVAIKPYLLKYDVCVTVKEKSLGGALIKSTATISDGVQKIKATSIVGVDLEQKGQNMPQKWGSASSYAKKYALGNLFLIDDSQDADKLNLHKQPLLENTPTFVKVEKAIRNGWSIEDVKKKFELSTEIELKLNSFKPIVTV